MEAAVKKFVRKPFYVDAVEVTSQNLVEAAKWCSGEIRDDADRRVETELVESMVEGAAKLHIYVRVQNPKNLRYTQAHVGDFIVYTEKGGYKVYTRQAFKRSFEEVTAEEPSPEATEPIPGVDEPVDRSTVPMPTPEERAAERTGAQGPEEV